MVGAMRLGDLPAQAATHAPTSPTFAITSPQFSGIPQGPVGTHVVVQAQPASGWTPGATITLSVNLESKGCDPTTIIPINTPTIITVQPDSSFTATFAWPANASQPSAATYVICASESGAGAQTGRSTNVFSVLANQPPSLLVSPMTAHAGDSVQITGTNWLPIQQITLLLQGVNLSFQQDSGEPLTTTPTPLYPSATGSFTVHVTLPVDRIANSTASNAQDIVAIMGTLPTNDTVYPLEVISPALNIEPQVVATVTPTVTAAPPTATPPGKNTTGSTPGTSTTKLLIILLGVIAVVLLIAGIIVAVLALRGRNTPPDGQSPMQRPNAGGYGGYPPQNSMDATVADSSEWPARHWDEDDRWQSPSGRPWSGNRPTNSPYNGRSQSPTPQPSPMDDEDDRYRTRMGDPYQSPPPPRPQGPPPPSRPIGPPPQSRPMPPRPNTSRPMPPSWDEDPAGQDTGPGWPIPPPRQ